MCGDTESRVTTETIMPWIQVNQSNEFKFPLTMDHGASRIWIVEAANPLGSNPRQGPPELARRTVAFALGRLGAKFSISTVAQSVTPPRNLGHRIRSANKLGRLSLFSCVLFFCYFFYNTTHGF